MAVGNWGPDIVFSVSDRRVLAFSGLSRTVGAGWAAHSRVGAKDQVEYLRPSLQKLSFTMELDASLGVRPRAVLELLERHAERGSVFPFVVGGRRVGRNPWRITEVSEAWETVCRGGELYRARVDVSMEEYV